jgi:hypothetical protein
MVAVNQQLDVADTIVATGGMQSPRHIGKTSNGVIWMGFRTGGNFNWYYSTDGGTTRAWGGPTMSQTFNSQILAASQMAFFIDADDYMHVLYGKYAGGANDGRSYAVSMVYRRGTPNAGRTDYTWSAESVLAGSDYWGHPDIIAVKIGTDVFAHMVHSYNWSNRQIGVYSRAKWSATGVLTWELASYFFSDISGGGGIPTYPSIDFRHDGLGKLPATVAGSQKPDIFVSYTSQSQSRMWVLPWTGSAWAASGTVETWETNYYVQPSAPATLGNNTYEMHRWVKTLYDAASDTIIVIGAIANTGTTSQVIRVYERPAAGGTWSIYGYGFAPLYSGAACLLPNGDLYVIGVSVWNPPNSTVSTGTINRQFAGSRPWTAVETLDTTVTEPQATLIQYPRGAQIDALFTDGNANPYSIRYIRVPLLNVWTYTAGAWKAVARKVYTGSAWVDHNPKVFT